MMICIKRAAAAATRRDAIHSFNRNHFKRSLSPLIIWCLILAAILNDNFDRIVHGIGASKLIVQSDYVPFGSQYNSSQRLEDPSEPSNNNRNNQFQQQQQQSRNPRPSSNANAYEPCCPCDEAKYELIFEGLWSKYTHPDEFPESELIAYFGDIIGASHSSEFRMWDQGSMASDGVKELAETGSTKRLESELKLVSSRTRTIIKARELHFPTLNSKTSAVFRTDRRHHLVSILSKLGPSPDWMVGVSSLNLCQSDCTWSSQRVVNLFPWDAGVDSGSDFAKSSNPTIPQEPIKPYKRVNRSQLALNPADLTGNMRRSPSNNNNNNNNTNSLSSSVSGESSALDSESSFNLDQSKAFARLTITRQRIYEKSCNHSDQATAQAGAGNRPFKSNNQQEQLNTNNGNQQPTHGWQPSSGATIDGTQGYTSAPSLTDCRYTNWSDWTSCSSSCGKGIRTRTRSFKNDRYAQIGACSISGLVEKEICLAECRANSTCYTRDWGPWSKCSVDCGQGLRKRTRAIIWPRSSACENVELAEEEPCIGMGDCSGNQQSSSARQNNNQQHRQQQQQHHHGQSAESLKGDANAGDDDDSSTVCKVTAWSAWTECSRHPCGGTRIRTRQYVNRESVGKCKVQLIQKRTCPIITESCRNILSEAASVCNLPASEGPCFGDFTRWYYDNSTRTCNTFTFRGCAGNANNFDTLQDCEQLCSKPMRKLMTN